VNDIWRLTDAELLAKAQERQEMEVQKQQDAATKKQIQSTKENEQFLLAYKKYNNNDNLLSEDLKALMKRVNEKNNTPLRSKVSELRA
jgi:hypothetical protein